MNNYLKSLDQSYVFAYILNYQPISGTDKGVMTIVDNTDNNITSLLSQYGFYIDNVFIAGGYGFSSLEELQNTKDLVDNFDEIHNQINNSINTLSDRKTLFVFKGTESSEIGNVETNLNVLSPEYNTYNFITSYHYFKLDEEQVLNSDDYKYTLSIKTQSNIKYIDNITITQINTNDPTEDSVIEVDNINANATPYKIRLEINQSDSSNILKYNEDIKLYLYSKLNEQYKNNPISLNNSEITRKDISFNKPSDSFNDDLVLELRKPGESIGEEKIIYSYIIPNFLRWQDKFIIYPKGNIDENYNKYNFRNTNIDLSSGECHSIYTSFIRDYFISSNYINVNTNNEIELEFQSNNPSYDYLILRNDYDIEFFFNGLQSLNWVSKEIQYSQSTYYIWQSPQKYLGNHTWKIKINI